MRKKRLLGAVLSGCFFLLYFGGLLCLFFFSGLFTGDVPLSIFIIFSVVLAIPFFGVLLALYYRIREIQNGEEDEAKKY